MQIFSSNPVEIVSCSNIDLENGEYRISRNYIDEKLKKNIGLIGLLEYPVILKKNSRYIIIFGHNRLRTLVELNINTFNALILEKIDPQSYLEYALLKCYRNEVGILGKIKLLSILHGLGFGDREVYRISRDCLSMDAEYIKKSGIINLTEKFPVPLRVYFDIRDINFKILKNLINIPHEGIELLSRWVEFCNIRVNIFKEIVEMMRDIFRRDNSFNALNNIEIFADDKKIWEEQLYYEIYKIRYPEYSTLKEKADALAKDFDQDGISIRFPEFFEGNTISVKLEFRKNEDKLSWGDRINKIDTDKLKKAFEFL